MSPAALIAALCACMLVACSGAHTIAEVFLIVICGQSNAEGVGAQVPGVTVPGVYQYRAYENIVAVSPPDFSIPLRTMPSNGYNYGTHYTLARALIAKRRIAVLKYAASGTSVIQWQRGTALGEGLRVAVADAKVRLASEFPGSTIRTVMVWIQGESDSLSAPFADAYQAREAQLFDGWRVDLGNPLIFDLGLHSGLVGCPLSATVNAAKVAVQALDPSRRIYDDPSVSAPGATFLDSLHYNQGGYDAIASLSIAPKLLLAL